MKYRFLIAPFILLAAAIPAAAHARVELFFEAAPQARVGSPVPVLLKARISEPINAMKVTVRFDPSRVTITAADDYESVVRYWLSRPGPSASGSLELEGIIPGGVGPGFTDTVLLARLTVVPSRAGPATFGLQDAVVYLNQPDAQEDEVTVRPLTISVRADAPEVVVAPAADPGEKAYIRVISEPGLNDGAWSLVFDIRSASGSEQTVLLRERRFGLGGTWRTAANTERLYDQTRTSIIEVAIPDGIGHRVVGRIVPFRLKALWAVIVAATALLVALRRKRLSY